MQASQRSDCELSPEKHISEGSKQLLLQQNAPGRGNRVCKGPGVSGLRVFAEQHGVQCGWSWLSKQETPLVLAQNFMQRVCQTMLTGFPSSAPRPPPVNERSENLGPEVGQDTSAGTRTWW